MKRHVAFLLLVMLLGIVLLGCEPTKPVATGPTGPPMPPPPPGSAPPPPPVASAPATTGQSATTGQAPLPPETKFGVFAGGIDDLAARPSAPPAQPSSLPPPAANTERVKAQAGVGAKGRSLDNEQGILVEPVKVFFKAQERIAFEQAFYGQYRLYRATEDAPKDYDELKAKVLDPYRIKLPTLPRGHKYVWDAASEELQVERPK